MVQISKFVVLTFLLVQCLTGGVLAQNKILIDVQSDIPNDGSWELDCENGYQEFSTDFECSSNGGGIDIPAGNLNGETGFWTQCGDNLCTLKFYPRPKDTIFRARVYQSKIDTEVSYDGVNWEYIEGDGWVEFSKELEYGVNNEIILHLQHSSPDTFSLLDKIVINGNFDLVPTSPTPPEDTSTTEVTTEEPIDTTPTPECPSTTVAPEPCDCCDRCTKQEIREVHHHHYYYSPGSVPKTKEDQGRIENMIEKYGK